MRHSWRSVEFCFEKSIYWMRLIELSTFGSLSISSNLASCNYAKLGGLLVCKFILTLGNLLTLATDEFGIS